MKKIVFAFLIATAAGCSSVSLAGDTFNVVSVSEEATDNHIEVGYNNMGFITDDHVLFMTGGNEQSELAREANSELTGQPVRIMDQVWQVSIGEQTVAAVTMDHELYMWGKSIAIGDANLPKTISKPYKVMDNVRQAEVVFGAMYALTDNGELYGFGNKFNGKAKIMDHVKSFETAYRISSATEAVAVITDTSDLYMFGSNAGLEMNPDSSVKNVQEPVKIDSGIIDTAIGDYFTLLLNEDGTVKAIGDYKTAHNTDSIYESPDESVRILLSQVEEGLGGVKKIEANNHAFLYLDETDKLWCYGVDWDTRTNYYGSVADNVKTFVCQYNSTIFLDQDNNIHAFGYSRQLMFGENYGDYGTFSSEPQLIVKMNDYTETPKETEKTVETGKTDDKEVIIPVSSANVPIQPESRRFLQDAIALGYSNITADTYYSDTNDYKELDYTYFVDHFKEPVSSVEYTYDRNSRQLHTVSYTQSSDDDNTSKTKNSEYLTEYGTHNFPIRYETLYLASNDQYESKFEYNEVDNTVCESTYRNGTLWYENVMDSEGHTLSSSGYDWGEFWEQHLYEFENGYKKAQIDNSYAFNKEFGEYDLTDTVTIPYDISYSGNYVTVSGEDRFGFKIVDVYDDSTHRLVSSTRNDSKTEYLYDNGLLTATVTFKMNGGNPSYITSVTVYNYD